MACTLPYMCQNMVYGRLVAVVAALLVRVDLAKANTAPSCAAVATAADFIAAVEQAFNQNTSVSICLDPADSR